MIELDNNATTKPLPEVVEAVTRALTEHWHNPSSVHRAGQEARRHVELARQDVANLVGVTAREVVFTSGATESIGLAIRGALAASPPQRTAIVTTAVEHEAVRDLCESLAPDHEVRLAPVDRQGVVDADALPDLLDDTVGIVSIQWANNETGAIQPVGRIARLCADRRIPFHTDATQWAGKMPFPPDVTPPLLSLSAHKFHGPKGVGALIMRRGARLRPIQLGAQELGRRGGTENAPGIAGMGAAARAAIEWLADPAHRDRLAALRDRFERAVLDAVPGTQVNGPTALGARLWNTTNIAFPRLEAEALLLLLSERGLNASAGAACSSGSLDPSPVLLAMGVEPGLAHGSVRFSLSRSTTPEEIDRAVVIVRDAVKRLTASAASLAQAR